jgi:hypothetical protein
MQTRIQGKSVVEPVTKRRMGLDKLGLIGIIDIHFFNGAGIVNFFIEKIERNEIAIYSAKPSFFIRVGKYLLPAIFPG